MSFKAKLLRTTTALAVAGAAFATLATQAQAEYPERPITMVIAYGPGGATDISARTIAEPLGKAVPQPLLMVNRTGAGGATGTRPLSTPTAASSSCGAWAGPPSAPRRSARAR